MLLDFSSLPSPKPIPKTNTIVVLFDFEGHSLFLFQVLFKTSKKRGKILSHPREKRYFSKPVSEKDAKFPMKNQSKGNVLPNRNEHSVYPYF